MLNKNQSNKRNSWKYLFVLPVLGAFVFFFQVKVVAQEKEAEQTLVENPKLVEKSVDIYKINKNTTDVELKEKVNALKEKYDITLAFSGIERNSKNELIAIKVDLKKGKEITKKMATKGTEAIKTFGIIISKNENGLLTVDFGTDDTVINKKSILISPNAPSVSIEKEIFIDGAKVSQEDLDKLDPKEIESMDVTKKSDKGTIRIVTKKFSKTINDNDIYIDGEKSDKDELLQLDQNTISKMDVNKNEKTIRITTKTIHQSADNIDIPTPPTPPEPPVEKKETSPDKVVNGWKVSGFSSLDGTKPLIVVDGKTKDANFNINNIPKEQIKKIDVLKGKVAADKYGDKGKNGVIEISTKTKKESELDKSEIENTKNEIVSSKQQRLETYIAIWKARFSLEIMKKQKEQAKADLEKSRKALKSKLFS